MDRLRRAALLASAFALVVSGCATSEPAPAGSGPASPSVSRTTSPPKPEAAAVREARGRLARLPVRKRVFGSGGYRRAAFGKAWADLDGNGCDQRADVLLRDAVKGTLRTARIRGCARDVLAGAWRDPYTGAVVRVADMKDFRQAGRVQIDHVVALGEAWLSGADRWEAGRRLRYANDVTVLVASDGGTNFTKGAKDPALWKPAPARRCWYARKWISIKSRWGLAADPAEKQALARMLNRC